jgi:hypothetical protein
MKRNLFIAALKQLAPDDAFIHVLAETLDPDDVPSIRFTLALERLSEMGFRIVRLPRRSKVRREGQARAAGRRQHARSFAV